MGIASSVVAIIALFATVILIVLRPMRTSPPHARMRSSRPADGVIEWQAVPGVLMDFHPDLPQVGRFAGIDPNAELPPSSLGRSRTAPQLLGDVVIWSIFVGRDGIDWSHEEIRLALEGVKRAASWIEDQATQWEAGVNLRLAKVYFAGRDDTVDDVEVGFQYNGEEVGPSEGDVEWKGMTSVSRVAATLGFRDLVDLIETISPRVPGDVAAWLVHVRRQGQSFAVSPDLTPIPGISLAFCFLREASFSEPLDRRTHATDAVTLAHEFLHLFGASDKYGEPLRSFPSGTVTERDIMRLGVNRLARLRIDRLTAAEIGWIQSR